MRTSSRDQNLQLQATALLRKRKQQGTAASKPDYRFRPIEYIRDRLDWEPWAGRNGQPGQVEIVQVYVHALRQQHEKLAYEQGRVAAGALLYWQPGQTIQKRIRVQSGHGTGKTRLCAGLVSHFFDSFYPAIVYTFAPTFPQINMLLWKYIRVDRSRPGFLGKVLETPELKHKPNHFAIGRATTDAGGKGTERIQGQHERYMLFVLDEAEGIEDYVWDAVEAMTTGGISVVLELGNPRTSISRFHQEKSRSDVADFLISCHDHINVVAGKELVPGAVKREYVETMLEKHCEAVTEHNEDRYTFELPWRPGEIWQPDGEYLFRVMGVTPPDAVENTIIPGGRYEAAQRRDPLPDPIAYARIGVDVSRWGDDYGTIYARHAGRVWRDRQLFQADSFAYYDAIKTLIQQLAGKGARNVHVRIDGTGGFGGGVIDLLRRDLDLRAMVSELAVLEIHFGGAAHDPASYADIVTEMYAEAAEALKGLRLHSPPAQLEADLTERKYQFVHRAGKSVRKLEEKEEFRRRKGRSPDDGDGFVLAVAPDHIFKGKQRESVGVRPRVLTAGELFGAPTYG